MASGTRVSTTHQNRRWVGVGSSPSRRLRVLVAATAYAAASMCEAQKIAMMNRYTPRNTWPHGKASNRCVTADSPPCSLSIFGTSMAPVMNWCML
ncbi:hypothetical protein D3C76_1712640 [compost metagenome]